MVSSFAFTVKPLGTCPSVRLIEGVRLIGVCHEGKYHEDAIFGTRLSVR